MSLASLLSRIYYPAREPFRPEIPIEDEIEGWVDASDLPYFSNLDEEFVDRALGLGVSSGMVLDLNCRLGLIPLKMLWKNENLLAMGVYSTEEMADRTRATATAWGMGERMFFQVGDPARFRFKDGYFDMVVSDGVLNQWADPERVLAELGRITKPTGAILIRDLVRPNRLAMSRHLQTHGAHYPDKLRGVHAGAVRAGFTPEEFLALSGTLNLDRVEVLADATHVLIERRGTDDPGSWVTERERYQ